MIAVPDNKCNKLETSMIQAYLGEASRVVDLDAIFIDAEARELQ